MNNIEEAEHQSFEEDLQFLFKTLKESFESTDVQYFVDDHNDTLYVKLEGLDEYPEEEIEEIATPIFEILDLDFDEIILLPL
ncbi:MAG TPA: hypothetical protein DCX27_02165 [Balneola sp.]|nr:hypothetical protein [Balneola sp.]